ncbi:MAG TPA: RraA family protein [Acidobacteriaceae bacterium]|nr:RraA family protein [Acidobacteriaceae bacterium]
MPTSNEVELFQTILQTLYTPVLGDVMDALGHTHQFLPQPVQAIKTGMRLVGRAMPVQIADVWGKQSDPFGLMTEALDQIEPGEVYVATGGSQNCAAWGEILTATARTRGGVGAVVDGFHRDTPRVLEQEWPVFSRGRYAQDAGVRSKVMDYRCPVEIAGVRIEPGDLIFGDIDGVLVVPHAIEEEAIARALEKARGEKVVRREIEAGMSSTDAFRKYGIL